MPTNVLERVDVTSRSVSPPLVSTVAPLEERFSSGDERLLEELYHENKSLIYSFCRRTLGPERAADVTQEVFFAAWKSRDRYRPECGSLAGWLIGIARFKIIDEYRVEQRNPLAPEAQQNIEQSSYAHEIEGMAQRMLLTEALNTLPTRARQIMHLAFFEDLTHNQISERCALPLGTVKSDVKRGLERLRRHLEGYDYAKRT